MQLRTFIMICLLFFSAGKLWAVSPEIRLPEWNFTEFGIADWEPDQKLLQLKAVVEAKEVDLKNVSCQLFQDIAPNQNGNIKEKSLLAAGDKAVFIFRLQIEPEVSAWINFDLRAQPDQDDLRKVVSAKNFKALTSEILNKEIESMNKPVAIGRTLPIFVAEDIALAVTREMAFRPAIKHKNRKLYIWLPNGPVGQGIAAETFRALQNAVTAGNYRSAVAACKLLVRKLSEKNEPLVMEKSKDEKFMIPASVAREMLQADQALFEALESQNYDKLKSFADAMKPAYSRGFVYFNHAQLLLSAKQNSEALKWFRKAAKDIPSWPEADRMIKSLTKK
jgi:hypothetical protein